MNPAILQAFAQESLLIQKEAGLVGATGKLLGKAWNSSWRGLNQASGTTKGMLQKGWKQNAGTGEFTRAATGPGKELLQHGGKWYTPSGALHRVGQGLRSAGRTLDPRTAGKELSRGWHSSGVYKNVNGKATEVGAGIGTKALTAGFTGLGLHAAVKPGQDPTLPGAGRGERLGKAIGSGAGFIGGMRGGIVSSMVSGAALGAVGGGIGKAVDGAGRLIRRPAGPPRQQ